MGRKKRRWRRRRRRGSVARARAHVAHTTHNACPCASHGPRMGSRLVGFRGAGGSALAAVAAPLCRLWRLWRLWRAHLRVPVAHLRRGALRHDHAAADLEAEPQRRRRASGRCGAVGIGHGVLHARDCAALLGNEAHGPPLDLRRPRRQRKKLHGEDAAERHEGAARSTRRTRPRGSGEAQRAWEGRGQDLGRASTGACGVARCRCPRCHGPQLGGRGGEGLSSVSLSLSRCLTSPPSPPPTRRARQGRSGTGGRARRWRRARGPWAARTSR